VILAEGEEPRESGDEPPVAPCAVMVVDQSAAMRGLLCRVLDSDPGIRVVATAASGRSAITALAEHDVDVVVLDSELYDAKGGALLPAILEKAPHVRVVMASPLTREGAASSVGAMASGAADYFTKPSLEHRKVAVLPENSLTEKVKALGSVGRASAPVMRRTDAERKAGQPARTQPVAKASPSPRRRPALNLREAGRTRPTVLAIAASTGGPPALFSVFRALGDRVRVPIFITQHMPPKFTGALADRVEVLSRLPAAEAVDGEVVADRIYVAPGDRHLSVERTSSDVVLRVTRGPRENYCRPAADPMFRSLAEVYGDRVLAVVLTGMGRDGLEGCRALVAADSTVIAQDEATSVVWGMPGAVATAGLCSAVLPVAKISDYIADRFSGAA